MELTESIQKPFKYSFDEKSEFLYLDRAIKTINK